MRSLYILVILCLGSTTLYSQKFTISGYIKDARTGESLIGASIIDLRTLLGTTSNTHGFFSITLSQDSVELVFSYVGYKRKPIKLFLSQNYVFNINLEGKLLEEVIIDGSQAEAIHETSSMSVFTIPIDQIKSLPALLGETDILKALQLMPGVQSGSEGSTGLYVRGGGADQNLILLDGVPIYNASHLFGFFSVFNADAINHVELTKGGFPARYGGRISSVVDINMKEGSMKELKGEGSIGLISSKFTIEGPIKKNKTSFIASARRTYVDIIAQPIIKSQSSGSKRGYYFYDVNLKFNHTIDSKNHLYLSTYFGDDKAYSKGKTSYFDINSNTTIDTKNEFDLMWGNIIGAFRWNHIFGSKLFSNITTTYSRYRFRVGQKFDEIVNTPGLPIENTFYGNQYTSEIRDWTAKMDFDYLPNPNHFIRFGVNNIFHKFAPGVYTYNSSTEGDTTAGAETTHAYELSFYFEDDWKISDLIKVNAGVHTSGFAVDNEVYYSIQPRVSSRLLLSRDLALKASYSAMTQYIHLLTNAGIGLPTDLWVSSTARIKPQQANQVALGLAKTYKEKYELSLETYYKAMKNLIEYKDGASYLNVDNDWQDNVVTNGKGKSYGLEILLQKKTGKTTGWFGYTLSKTTRQFDQLNFGKEFPYKYERRHDISLAIMHKFNKKIELSLVWVFGTGYAITIPIAVYEGSSNNFDTRYVNSSRVTYYGDRNSYRMKSYHRLDLSCSWKKEKKWGQRAWTVAIYNVYNRLNPYFIDLGLDKNNNLQFIEYSLFPIMPSVSYSFKF